MKSIIRSFINTVFFIIGIIFFSMTAFADQTYYYSYTVMAGGRLYKEKNNLINSITITQNQDGSYTARDELRTVILRKETDGSYGGESEDYDYYELNNNGIRIIFVDGVDYFSLTPFTEGWLKLDNGKWYYIGSDGTCTKNQWVGNYYLGYDGAMLTNAWTPDGYWVGTDGEWDGQNYSSSSTSNNSSYVVNSGAYGGNHPPYGDFANIYSVSLSGNVLTVIGSLMIGSGGYDGTNTILPNNIYTFQLSENTQFVERGFIDEYITRAEFEQLLSKGWVGPWFYVVVQNGLVTEIGHSS